MYDLRSDTSSFIPRRSAQHRSDTTVAGLVAARSCASGVILSSDVDGIEIFADHSCRGTLVFDFRNQARSSGVSVVDDDLEKIARPSEFGNPLTEFLKWNGDLGSSNFFTFAPHDCLEYVWHSHTWDSGDRE